MSSIEVEEHKKLNQKLRKNAEVETKNKSEHDSIVQFGREIFAKDYQKNHQFDNKTPDKENVSDGKTSLRTNEVHAANTNSNGGVAPMKFSKKKTKNINAYEEEEARKRKEYEDQIILKKELIQKEFEKNQKEILINFTEASKSNEAKVLLL